MSMATTKNKPRPKSPNASSNGATRRSCDLLIDDDILIPGWVNDFDSFNRWVLSDQRPDRGKFSWLAGDIWIELQAEAFTYYPYEDWHTAKSKKLGAANGRAIPRRHDGTIIIDEAATIPSWIHDFESFHRWTLSDDFPEYGRYSFLNGQVWADLSMETTIHNQIKSVISIVVGAIILREIWGRTFVDRMRFVHPITGVSHEPDGIFVSTTSLESGRVTVKGGDRAVVLSGSPDMALEVVSKSSAKKDLKTAMVEYAKAGISEYWVVDSRSNNPELAIYRLVNDEYVAARKMGGWMKSKVLGRSFRLTSKKGPQDVTFFDLETK